MQAAGGKRCLLWLGETIKLGLFGYTSSISVWLGGTPAMSGFEERGRNFPTKVNLGDTSRAVDVKRK
jgi:hypothetical protein